MKKALLRPQSPLAFISNIARNAEERRRIRKVSICILYALPPPKKSFAIQKNLHPLPVT